MSDNVALSYEASIRYLVEQSNKRAWLVAFIAMVISILNNCCCLFNAA